MDELEQELQALKAATDGVHASAAVKQAMIGAAATAGVALPVASGLGLAAKIALASVTVAALGGGAFAVQQLRAPDAKPPPVAAEAAKAPAPAPPDEQPAPPPAAPGVAAPAVADGGAPSCVLVKTTLRTREADGVTVPRVSIQAIPRKGCPMPESVVETDGAGLAQIDLPMGFAHLLARSPTRFGNLKTTVTAEGGPIDVFMTPTDRVKVTVRDDQGPLAGATVSFGYAGEGTTGVDGIAWIDGIPTQGALVDISAEGHTSQLHEVDLRTTQELAFRLERGVEVLVTVLAPPDCEHVMLDLVPGEKRSSAEDGAPEPAYGTLTQTGWRFVVTPGRYTLSEGLGERLCTGQRTFDVGAAPMKVELALESKGRGCVNSGVVLDETGRPREGVRVASTCTAVRATTDAKGEFTLPGKMGRSCELMVDEGMWAARCGVPVRIVTGSGSLTVKLTGAAATAQPMVTVHGPNGFTEVTPGNPLTLRGLAPGTYHVLLGRVGYASAEVQRGRHVTIEMPVVEGKATVRGIVVDERGAPVAGAAVSTHGEQVSSAADGRFELSGRYVGPHVLTAWTSDGRVGATGYTVKGNETLDLGKVTLSSSPVRDLGFRVRREKDACLAVEVRADSPAGRAGLKNGEPVRLVQVGFRRLVDPSCETLDALTLRFLPGMEPVVLLAGPADDVRELLLGVDR